MEIPKPFANPTMLFGAISGVGFTGIYWAIDNGVPVGEYLGFLRSLIGAAAGIYAAFMAVSMSQHSADERDLKTLRDLLNEFDDRAADMELKADTNPVPAVSAAIVHYFATRDAAIGMRTRGANVAKVAAQLEVDAVGTHLQRLHFAENGVVAVDVQARADELKELGELLLATLANGL